MSLKTNCSSLNVIEPGRSFALLQESGVTGSEVITDLCTYCLDDKEIIDEIYPYEEEYEEEDEEEY